MRGQIVKGIAGFYFVKSGETISRCRARGVFKNQGIKPAVGDFVEFEEASGEDDGVVREILPRKNSFIRPFVANVDCFVIVVAAANPDPVPQVIDKLLVTAEQADAESIICINKCDLAETGKKREKAAESIETIRSIYGGMYKVICTSKDEEESLRSLREAIKDKTVAFAGASGGGKSTIVNRLLRRREMETGAVSDKTSRGRHTTRHAELFSLDEEEAKIFDTPGFTSFDLQNMKMEEIGNYFPEMAKRAEGCRYDDCMHLAEPGCRVKEALTAGEISQSRYDSYCAFVEQARGKRQY